MSDEDCYLTSTAERALRHVLHPTETQRHAVACILTVIFLVCMALLVLDVRVP